MNKQFIKLNYNNLLEPFLSILENEKFLKIFEINIMNKQLY